MNLESLIRELIQILPLLRVRVNLAVKLSLSGLTRPMQAKRKRMKADRMV
jgi:hypothetical protein